MAKHLTILNWSIRSNSVLYLANWIFGKRAKYQIFETSLFLHFNFQKDFLELCLFKILQLWISLIVHHRTYFVSFHEIHKIMKLCHKTKQVLLFDFYRLASYNNTNITCIYIFYCLIKLNIHRNISYCTWCNKIHEYFFKYFNNTGSLLDTHFQKNNT